MYGEEASKLARETKRTVDHFPPYNDPLVRSITREIRHLHETCQALIRDYGLQKQQVEHEFEQKWQQLHEPSSSSAGMASTSRNDLDLDLDPNHTTLSMLEDNNNNGDNLGSSSSATLPTSQVSRLHPPDLQAQKQEALQSITEVFWTKYLVHQTPLQRKNGCIVNTGAKLSREEIRRRVAENKEQYELTEEEWTMIELPLPEDPQLLLEAKRSEKIRLELELKNVQRQIAMLRKSGKKIETDSSDSPKTEQDDEEQEDMIEDQPSGKRPRIEA